MIKMKKVALATLIAMSLVVPVACTGPQSRQALYYVAEHGTTSQFVRAIAVRAVQRCINSCSSDSCKELVLKTGVYGVAGVVFGGTIWFYSLLR